MLFRSREKKRIQRELLSAADGEVFLLDEVPDEAFSSGMLGEGYAVRPENGVIRAPVAGRIGSVSDSMHAYSIDCDIGDVLVHVGIDTVTLKNAFEPHVSAGDEVCAGQQIAHADIEMIRNAGLDPIIPVIITDKAVAGEIKVITGNARGGDTVLYIEDQRKD